MTTSTHAQVEVLRKHRVLELVHVWESRYIVVNDPLSGREGDEKSPLSPQVHAADITQDSRTHMDKKAKISEFIISEG